MKCPKCGHELAPPEQSEFDKWYRSYPRRIGRGAAIKAYARALTKTDSVTLLTATATFAGLVAGKDKDFIPFPATWLNQERWLDDGTAPEGEPRAFHPSWEGEVVILLIAAIGKDHAVAYFSDVELSQDHDGTTVLIVPSAFRLEKIGQTYGPRLWRVFPLGWRLHIRS